MMNILSDMIVLVVGCDDGFFATFLTLSKLEPERTCTLSMCHIYIM